MSYERERASWLEDDEDDPLDVPTRISEGGTAEEKAACDEEPMRRGL